MGRFGACQIKGCKAVGLLLGPNINNLMVCPEHLTDATVITDRNDVKALAKQIEKETKKTQDQWFKEQEVQRPKLCECGCGETIRIPANMTYKTAICHIFPKGIYKSVKVHPLNRWFGTWQHHTDYDNATWDKKILLPIWKVIEPRAKLVYQDISKPELKHLPEELRALLETTKTI